MEVNDKLHDSAALLPGIYLPVPTEQKAGWALGRISKYDSSVVDWSLHPLGWSINFFMESHRLRRKKNSSVLCTTRTANYNLSGESSFPRPFSVASAFCKVPQLPRLFHFLQDYDSHSGANKGLCGFSQPLQKESQVIKKHAAPYQKAQRLELTAERMVSKSA
jgi:hypothetical protein